MGFVRNMLGQRIECNTEEMQRLIAENEHLLNTNYQLRSINTGLCDAHKRASEECDAEYARRKQLEEEIKRQSEEIRRVGQQRDAVHDRCEKLEKDYKYLKAANERLEEEILQERLRAYMGSTRIDEHSDTVDAEDKYREPYKVATLKSMTGVDIRWSVVDSNGRLLLAYSLNKNKAQFIADRLNLADELEDEVAQMEIGYDSMRRHLMDVTEQLKWATRTYGDIK
jgi:chromosome segregation ATPase